MSGGWVWKCPGEKPVTGGGVHREIQCRGVGLRIGLQAGEPQLLSPWAAFTEAPEPCKTYPATREATSMRSPLITTRDAAKESPHTSKEGSVLPKIKSFWEKKKKRIGL